MQSPKAGVCLLIKDYLIQVTLENKRYGGRSNSSTIFSLGFCEDFIKHIRVILSKMIRKGESWV